MNTPKDEKYIVFKREEWDEWTQGRLPHELRAIDDAVVIRTQDAFAARQLHGYAYAINEVIEMFTELLNDNGIAMDMDVRSKINGLRNAADYMHSRAVEAETTTSKLPD